MKKIMKEKNQVVPDEVLSKEFLSQFKTEADVSKFLKQLHAQVLEKMLEGEMDAHLGYEKNSIAGNNSGNSRNGSYPKKIQTEHGEAVISIPRDRNGQFEPIAVPKHESRGLSIEKLVISLYAKGMSVSDIEEEMREIYEIELSTSAISIITNKVNQAAQEWQNRPLDPVYLIVWMDGIVFKVRDNGKIINKTVYLCVGLKQNGLKEVLGMWVGVASLHAPMCKHIAEEAESQESTCYLRAVLEGNMPCYTTPSHWLNRAGEVRARVVGGNLAVLTGLLRTPYDIFQEDTILFIEDVGERTYKVERMLYNLELSGVLPRLAGLIVGRFTDYNEDPGMCMTLYEAVWARVARYSYPVCFDFPVGHVPQNHPMIEGAVATLTVAPQGVILQF